MAWTSLGAITVATPGTRTRLTVNQTDPTLALKCQTLFLQVLSTNTGKVYLYDRVSGGSPLVILPIPTSTNIPTVNATIPDAPAALNAGNYYLDVDVGGEGANGSYMRP
jgi:hypothetical protein